METDDDLDTHICLSCQLPIIGLDNYVFHKKHECSAKKRKHSQAANLPQPVSNAFSQVTSAHGDIQGADGTALQVTPAQLSPAICQAVNLQLSPVASQAMTLLTKTLTTTVATSGLNSGTAGSYSAVNPNMVLNTMAAVDSTGHGLSVSETDDVSNLNSNLSTTTPSIMGFLSTLELQCRPHTSPGKLGSSATDTLDDQSAGLESRVPDGLKLANLLNDLNFDSDSEGFDMPSDAEDFLNFTEEDYHELGAQYVTGTSGGKGKGQGEGKGHGKGKSKGKTEYFHTSGKNRKSIPGKWRPGERSGGKLASAGRWMSIGKRHYEEMSSDGEQAEQESATENTQATQEQDTQLPENSSDNVTEVPQEPVNTEQTSVDKSPIPNSTEDSTVVTSKTIDSMEATAVDVLLKINSNNQEPAAPDHTYDGSVAPQQEGLDHTYDTVRSEKGGITPLKCEPCDRLFKNALALHSHMKSSQHKAAAAGLPIVKASKNTDKQFHVECTGCQRSFNNKYNYARHLVSALHLKRSKSSLLHLDPAFQRLLLPLKLFQCRICLFYCNTHKDLLNHMSSSSHNDKVEELVGPMICVRCKFSSHSRREIYEHFTTSDHIKTISKSDRPCLLREVRHNLPCIHCGKVFHSATKLQQHYNIQHPIKQEKCKGVAKQTFCDLCKRNFSTHYNWAQHTRRKHKQNGQEYRCDICDTKNFADQSYLDHHYKSRKHLDNVLKASAVMSKDDKPSIREVGKHRRQRRPPLNKTESRKMYKCKECEYSSTVYTDLRPHYIEVHSKNIVYDFVCETCGFGFDTQLKLDKHLQSRKHLQTEKEAKEASHQAITCSTCNRKFYSQDRYSLHVLSHKTNGMELQQGRKGLSKLKGVPERFHKFVMKLPSGHTKDVQCPECKEWCKCNNIVPHIRGKHGDPNQLPYKCNFCPKSFPSNASLYRHHKAHLGVKSFLCKICSKAYRSKSDLETHELVLHSSELDIVAKFKCFFCGESFMQRNRLNIHLKKKHEKERAYPCRWPGCHRQFIYQSEYERHVRVHTGERPFLCDTCGHATKTKVQLRRHEKSHTGESNHKCKYCTYSASHSWGLRRHMRIHSGVKPYKCPHCDYRCNCHTNLRHHIITSKRHPGKCLYHCKECIFATNRGIEFQQHCIELHSIPPEKVENVAEYCGVYLPHEDSRDVLEGSQILPVPERKPRMQKNSLLIASEQNNETCIQDFLGLDVQEQKPFDPQHQIISNNISIKTEQTQQDTTEMMPQVHQIIFQQQSPDDNKTGCESQGSFISQIVGSHEVIQSNGEGIIQQELQQLGEQEVTQIPFNSDLTHLLAVHEGTEHTGAVVELRMEDNYTFTTRSGQSLQIVGQDNKPVHLYYA